jgi:hypothetical protein
MIIDAYYAIQGIHGHDLDTVFVLHEHESQTNETDFDQVLRKLKYDSSALSDYITNLLEGQIRGTFNDEIVDYRQISALFPILSVLFTDQTQVEIFVQIDINHDEKTTCSKSTIHSDRLFGANSSIHGVSKNILLIGPC